MSAERQRAKMKKATKAELLARYAEKIPCRFAQFDVFTNQGGGDDVMRPDDDGDCLFSGLTTELMTGLYAVRVLVTEGTPTSEALRALQKITAWVEAAAMTNTLT
jgi:hypothetical protein